MELVEEGLLSELKSLPSPDRKCRLSRFSCWTISGNCGFPRGFPWFPVETDEIGSNGFLTSK